MKYSFYLFVYELIKFIKGNITFTLNVSINGM